MLDYFKRYSKSQPHFFGLIMLYWRTLKYLKPTQIYMRIWFLISNPKPNFSAHPPKRGFKGVWQDSARRESSLIASSEFRFLDQIGRLEDIGWNGSEREKLWRYNQHYFDDLNARNFDSRINWHISLLSDWIKSNPPGIGVGWEPYPTSLRVINWIKWMLSGQEMPDDHIQSLAVQVRWLEKRLERHLLGNHLFSNAKALIFAGIYFEGSDANRWLRVGLEILKQELQEQILPDGGHFELSTMYHIIAMEDLLDLINLLLCYESVLPTNLVEFRKSLVEKFVLMMDWSKAMSHPDGGISFFNDAAFGIAPDLEEIIHYAARLGLHAAHPNFVGSKNLKYSGYARLENQCAVAILDMAPVGPDYLPGHAHADTLSFELSLYGERVFVNTGTSCYRVGPEREHQRGTLAHNTVTISDFNSSEVWGSFRVARRARPIFKSVELGATPLRAECSHDGYMRLQGRPIHLRKWEMGERYLIVEDSIDNDRYPSRARFYLSPNAKLEIDDEGVYGEIILSSGYQLQLRVEIGSMHIEPTFWHPFFGRSMANQCLIVDLKKGQSKITFSW